MKAGILVLVFTWLPASASAASNVTLTVDGENYICQQSSTAVSCRCVEDRSEIDFRLNGKEVKVWYGNTPENMIECVKHLRSQSFCN